MAVMIPERPRTFAPASQEGLMFEALELLPDEYYVFHSFRITDVRNVTVKAGGGLSEWEQCEKISP